MEVSPLSSLVALLREVGMTHVVGLPDNTSGSLFSVLTGEAGEGVAAGSELRLLTVTREGEGIALAAGLWLGGAFPVVLIQNTGLLEAGDSLRGTASRMGAPLLLLVTCRGYGKARASGVDPGVGVSDRDHLVSPDLDSVALMTEPTLRAWGIPFLRWAEAGDLTPVRKAIRLAREEERPVAVLVDTVLS